MGNYNIIQPKAATNIITNPSFETGTTGYTATGTNTIAQSSDYQFLGDYALKCTYNNSTTLATFASVTLTAAAYAYSVRVYIPADWDGGAVQLAIANFTSATTNTATSSLTTTGEWVRAGMVFTPDGGDLTGDIQVKTASAPTAGKFIYIDCVQLELGTQSTTEFDGDSIDCKWAGEAHNSQSTRPEWSGRGGLVLNFENDLNMPVKVAQNMGMTDVTVLEQNQASLPGSAYIDTVANRRALQLNLSHSAASTLLEYHSLRQRLIKLMDGKTGHINEKPQPRIIRYTGAAATKEIEVYYEKGADIGLEKGFQEPSLPIGLISTYPYFTGLGWNSAAVDVEDSLAGAVRTYSKVNGVWGNLPGLSDNTQAYVIEQYKHLLYIGGSIVNNDTSINMARVTTDGTFTDLSVNGDVYSIAILPSGGVYAGATAAATFGGVTCRGIGYWNGSWAALGPPSAGGDVLAIDTTTDGHVWIGGAWATWDGITGSNLLAIWNPAGSWARYSSGTTTGNAVNTIKIDGDIKYVGGDFTMIANVAIVNIAKITSTTKEQMGTAITAIVHDIDIAADGTVYALAADGLYRWNNSDWDLLGAIVTSGTPTRGNIAFDGNRIYVAIDGLQSAGGVSTTNIAIYDGGVWFPEPISPIAQTVYYDSLNERLMFSTAANSLLHEGEITINYEGTAPAYPIIYIKREVGDPDDSAALVRIENATTKAALYFAPYSLENGEELTIDLRPGRRQTVSSVNGLIQPLLQLSDIGSFFLVPSNDTGTRENNITAFCDISGTVTITAFIRWQNAYASFD